MKHFPFLAVLLLSACAHPARRAPNASTAALSEGIARAQGNVTAAQDSAKRAGANVERARGNADRLGTHLDTIDYKGMRLKKLLEEK